MKRKLLAALGMLLIATSLFAQVSYKDKNLYGITDWGCLYFDSSVTKIAKDGFRGLKEIKEVEIPEQIVYIGEDAFSDCPNLQVISYNAINCKDCTGPAFRNDTITMFGISSDVKTIPAYIFSEMKGKIRVELNYARFLESIGDYAFYNTAVSVFAIPDSLKKIGKKSFTDVYSISGDHNTYAVEWFRQNNFELKPKINSKDKDKKYDPYDESIFYIIKDDVNENNNDTFVATVEPEPVPAKPVNKALEDFINTDIETIGGKKIVTKTPKQYYNTTWLSQDEKSGCRIDGEGYLSEFVKADDGNYVYEMEPVLKLEANGTVKPKNRFIFDDIKLSGNTLAIYLSERSARYTKTTKNIKVRKRSLTDKNTKTIIACDKTTMPENGTIMFYIDGGFDEKWSSVAWHVSRKLKKDSPVEWYEPEHGYNQEPFYLHGLEEGTYQVYAGSEINKSNIITVTVTKSTDPEKRFVAPGKIWAPKDIYSVGEKCWLDVVTDKPVKDVEWTILSLYKTKEQTLNYTEGTHFYFTCKNEGIYKVTAKTNYKDGTFAEDTVRIVSTVKNPQTTEGFWIRYENLDNFYNYIYPRRSWGFMVKNSKVYKLQDQEEDSSTRADYIVDAYPLAEFKNGKIVSLDPDWEFTYEKDRIHLERKSLIGEYGKIDFIRVPHAKIKYRQTPLPTKKRLDSKSELVVTNWDRPERTYTLGSAIGILIHGEVGDYVAEPIDYSLFVDGKKISDQIIEYYFQPETPGDYVLEVIAKGRESGVTVSKKITYHVVANETEKKEEPVSTWPVNRTSDPFPIDPVKYYLEGKQSSFESLDTIRDEPTGISAATKEFLDDIRKQLKTGIVKVVADDFNDFDMDKLNEVLREAENDFAIDFNDCYGSYSTYIRGNEHVVCVKNAKKIIYQSFLDCPNIRKVSVYSMRHNAKSAELFITFFDRKNAAEEKYDEHIERTSRGKKTYSCPSSLETVIFNDDKDEDVSTDFFKYIEHLKTLEIRGEKVELPSYY